MGESFKAAVAVPGGGIELQAVTIPEPSPATGLLRVSITGVCGSDWGFFQYLPKSRGPVILGHETVGHVQAAGAIATLKWGVKEGDLVAL